MNSDIFRKNQMLRVVSHIPKFGDASKSPAGDTASPVGDAASPSDDAVVSHWRYIISFRDALTSTSPAGDAASPNCEICDTVREIL